MENNTTTTENNKVVERKASKLEILKSLNGNIKKLESQKLVNETELKTLKTISTRLKNDVIGEL